MAERSFHVLSMGAGVQTTTLYLLKGQEYDVAIFADTQDEPNDLYGVHLPWLLQHQGELCPLWVRTKGKLSEHLARGVNSTGQRFASIPAFTDGEEKEGRLRRQCSREYKTEIVERAIRQELLGLKPRQRVPQNVRVYEYFGITTDEVGRAGRIQKRLAEEKPWITPRFPFITELQWSRKDCEQYNTANVPHPVPRSACVFCPLHNDYEWLRMKTEHPDDWKRAITTDRDLRRDGVVLNRNLNQKLYLHRSLRPIDEIDFAEEIKSRRPSLPMFLEECEGVCGV